MIMSAPASDGGFQLVDSEARVAVEYDQLYYCPDVVIRAEDILFRIPRVLLAQSQAFHERFLAPIEGRLVADGLNDTRPLRLDGVSAADFRQFLRVLFPLRHGATTDLDADGCMSVLRLSTQWSFASVRTTAIDALEPFASEDPILKIVAALQYDILDWLVPGLNTIARRNNALTSADVRRLKTLGDADVVMDLVLMIAQVREAFVPKVARPSNSREPGSPSSALCFNYHPCHHHGISTRCDGLRDSGSPDRQHFDFTAIICNIFHCHLDGRPKDKRVTGAQSEISAKARNEIEAERDDARKEAEVDVWRAAEAEAEAEAEAARAAADEANRVAEEQAEVERLAAEERERTVAEEARRLADADAEADAEVERIAAEVEAEAQSIFEEQVRRAADAEAELKRLAAEEVQRVAAAEAEAKRIAEEAQRAAEAYTTAKRVAAEENDRREKEDAARKRAADEAAARKKKFDEQKAEGQRMKAATKQRKKAEEAERKRQEAQATAKRQRQTAAAAEQRRLAAEEAKCMVEEEARLNKEAQEAARQKVEADAETERQRLAELEAQRLTEVEGTRATIKAAEAERTRLEEEANCKANKEECTRVKAQDEEAERQRLVDERQQSEATIAAKAEAARIKAEHAEAERVGREDDRKAEEKRVSGAAEPEEQRKAEEKAAEQGAKRQADEVEAKQTADEVAEVAGAAKVPEADCLANEVEKPVLQFEAEQVARLEDKVTRDSRGPLTTSKASRRAGSPTLEESNLLTMATQAAAEKKETDVGEPTLEAAFSTPLPPMQCSTSFPETPFYTDAPSFPILAAPPATLVAQGPPRISAKDQAEVDEVVARELHAAEAALEKAIAAAKPLQVIADAEEAAAAKLEAESGYDPVKKARAGTARRKATRSAKLTAPAINAIAEAISKRDVVQARLDALRAALTSMSSSTLVVAPNPRSLVLGSSYAKSQRPLFTTNIDRETTASKNDTAQLQREPGTPPMLHSLAWAITFALDRETETPCLDPSVLDSAQLAVPQVCLPPGPILPLTTTSTTSRCASTSVGDPIAGKTKEQPTKASVTTSQAQRVKSGEEQKANGPDMIGRKKKKGKKN